MQYLVFQLQAPLSSWGEPAVGEFRGTADRPGQSALVGLLGAALGLIRIDEDAHAALRDSYGFAVGLLSSGQLLRDYHTAQVPPTSTLKGRPHRTRRDEMNVPKQDLGTILSTRDYRQNAASLVAVQPRQGAILPHSLEALANALREPRFTLFLGRKTCVPGAPLWPQVLEAETVQAAFFAYGERFEKARQSVKTVWGEPALDALPHVQSMSFDEHIHAGVAPDLSTRRKDRLIRRKNWQFGDRDEFVAFLADPARPSLQQKV